MSGLSRALVGFAVAGFALGLAALALVMTSDREQDPVTWIVLALTMGWSFIGAGLYAWWRRPENASGASPLTGWASAAPTPPPTRRAWSHAPGR